MAMRRRWHESPAAWAFIFKKYLPCLAALSLAWEIAHLPLYTIGSDERLSRVAFAVAHCTAGDILIGIATLILALILSRAGEPGDWPIKRVGIFTVVFAVSYTLPSERINITLGNWAYSTWMPVLPGVEVGLTPLLQWIVVPFVALWWTRRQLPLPR